MSVNTALPPPIICDTNIWYSIGKGSIKATAIENLDLYYLPSALFELASTPKLYSNPLLVKTASQALIRKGKLLTTDGPFDVIVKSFGLSDCFANKDQILELQEYIRIFASMREKDVTARLGLPELKLPIDNLKSPIYELEKKANEKSIPLLRKNRNRKKMSDEERKYEIIKLLTQLIHEHSFKTITITNDSISDNNIQLLVSTFSLFNKRLEKENAKFRANDWNDLFNLAYISPNNLYWTLDRLWIDLIKKAGFKEQIFEL